MTEFDCTFRTDRLGDPERRVVIMVATDSVNISCLSLMARRTEAQDEYVDEGMLNDSAATEQTSPYKDNYEHCEHS